MTRTYHAMRSLAVAASMVAASIATGHAQGWVPTEEVEIVSHTGTTSSTWTNPDAISKVIKELNLFPEGVTVTIVDAMGREIATLLDAVVPSGAHEVRWEPAAALPAGAYYCRIGMGEEGSAIVPMVLVR